MFKIVLTRLVYDLLVYEQAQVSGNGHLTKN